MSFYRRFSLLQFLDDMSDDEHNRFTKRDILDAMQFYQENYVTYSRREAERVSAIAMPASKRNGRKQAEHLERARLVQTLDYPMEHGEIKRVDQKAAEKSRRLSKNGNSSIRTERR